MEPRWRGRSEGSAPLSLVLAFAHPGACKWKAICSSFNVRLGPPSYCFHDNIATALVKDCQCSFLLSVDSIHHNKYSLVSVCIRDIAPYYEVCNPSAAKKHRHFFTGCPLLSSSCLLPSTCAYLLTLSKCTSVDNINAMLA
eukprot:scaffold219256_cov17-Tisochrysis_lutea.AAC.1